MTTSVPRRLPRGRHALSREEVARAQRGRLIAAMAEAMSEQGFVNTSVGDVLKRAGVSRQSFYQLFSSKLDCFMAAFDEATRRLEERLDAVVSGPGGPLERFERGITTYVEMLAREPAYARLFVVEVYAAGPEALARRAEFQERLSGLLAPVLEAPGEEGRFGCRAIVAAVSSMVTVPLLDGDAGALRELGTRINAHVRTLKEHGVL
ncbi:MULTISPECIES: TetR/AcrR family transcriptional regulator [Thermomonosporaceae]|uniref:TetR/AcrR family transcriptional regulator n=1 Tax=Thermomonosporaceae TaxID=2012 RepID=UPI00255B10A8|nr:MULTISPECIES: TetR/AcrR family transcriptional regulator [Thermomonosporaceae]MDL4772349.1 TetR/AcrR family transcriptional regulator [Actinomadura xylanilytica]